MDIDVEIVTIEEVLQVVKSGDDIVFSAVVAEPMAFAKNIHKVVDYGVRDITITTCMSLVACDYYTNEQYLEHFTVKTWFESAVTRKMHKYGKISFIPNHLHLIGVQAAHTNIFVCTVSRPNIDGKVSLGLSNVYESIVLEKADIVVFEVNENMPFVYGAHIYDLGKADYVIYENTKITELPTSEVSEKDGIIGKLIADQINNGDCLQIGIGGIPNAICGYLKNKRHLGVHTEMFSTGIMELLKMGVITNEKKQTHIGKTVCCFALGNRTLYDYMDSNEDLLILSANHVNMPCEIAKNDNQVSINTTIEIDLTGQCCSESIGFEQFSGTGGQADTAVGAQRSKNGRSFIALYSTAMAKNRETQEREEVSKIVLSLKPGAAVSLGRNDVQYVVTECGMVNLQGLSISERATALISIAHPKFREQLTADAKTHGLM